MFLTWQIEGPFTGTAAASNYTLHLVNIITQAPILLVIFPPHTNHIQYDYDSKPILWQKYKTTIILSYKSYT